MPRKRGIIVADTKFEFGLFEDEMHPDRRSASRPIPRASGRPINTARA